MRIAMSLSYVDSLLGLVHTKREPITVTFHLYHAAKHLLVAWKAVDLFVFRFASTSPFARLCRYRSHREEGVAASSGVLSLTFSWFIHSLCTEESWRVEQRRRLIARFSRFRHIFSCLFCSYAIDSRRPFKSVPIRFAFSPFHPLSFVCLSFFPLIGRDTLK